VPLSAADVAFVAFVALLGAAVVSPWRQARLGYYLALALAAVQITLMIPITQSMTAERVTRYIAFSFGVPAAIPLILGLMYLE
jgi:hypothetical protein